jgi:predicted DNA-binding transcriptional regulator YafY
VTPTERRLDILAAVQAWPGISAVALAERLGVSERTARRDVEHLRRIGYGIDSDTGRYGGYTLRGGSKLPPLLLDADEAAAVALGLTADLGVSGLELAAGTALAKVSDAAPARARGTLTAVGASAQAAPDHRHQASSRVLLALAHACRQRTSVYLARQGDGRRRRVQPHRLVKVGSRWYLVACAQGRNAWSLYALARMTRVDPAGPGLPTPPPPPYAADFARASLATAPRRHQVRVRLHTSADLARELVGPATATIDDEGASCLLTLATDDLDWAARYLVYLNIDFDVVAPAALTTTLHDLGGWLARRHPA